MAKSSIHIDKGHAGFLAHNDRSQKTHNSIFPENKNEVWNNQKQAFAIYKKELAARSDAYKKRTGQKLQKNAITHLSAIVNLNADHTMEDLAKVGKYLQDTFDTKMIQMAIHRDEGHIADDGTKEVNYHAHIEFMGLDSQGQSVRRKLDKRALTKLQSQTAKLLGMERGKNYAKDKAPRPKRLDTYEFKAHKKLEQEQRKEATKKLMASQKMVNDILGEARAKLKKANAERKDYAELEAVAKKLKQLVKHKDLTIADLQEQNKLLKAKISSLPTQDLTGEVKRLKTLNKELFEVVAEQREELKKKDKPQPDQARIQALEMENRGLRADLAKLSDKFQKMKYYLTEKLARVWKGDDKGLDKSIENYNAKHNPQCRDQGKKQSRGVTRTR